MDAGLMDMFVQFDEPPYSPPPGGSTRPCRTSDVMGYFDGNTVTLCGTTPSTTRSSDNSFGTTYGPSTPGALNLVSGQTHGADAGARPDGATRRRTAPCSAIPTRRFDDCSDTAHGHRMSPGTNVGDLLNRHGVTWGWFQGGFRPTSRDRAARPSAARRTRTSAACRRGLRAAPRAVPVLPRRPRTRTTCRRPRSR